MAVPRDLRDAVGRTVWRHYLPRMIEDEARLAALQLAIDYKRRIVELRRRLQTARPDVAEISAADVLSRISTTRPRAEDPTPVAQKTISADRPGWRGLRQTSEFALTLANDNVKSTATATSGGTSPGILGSQGAPAQSADAGGCIEPSPAGAPAPASAQANVGAVETTPAPDFARDAPHRTDAGDRTVADLVALWQRVTQPRARRSVHRMHTCAAIFAKVNGELPPTEVCRHHILAYRDHLETTDLSRSTAGLYLQGLHRLFAIAVSEGLLSENPSNGIHVRPGAARFADRERRRPFDAGELKAIFGALAAEPPEFAWLVRLLTYHGMRSGEAAQLRAEDVTTLFGVPVLRIHDRFGSLKNRFSQRDIPLHPACAGFLDYVRSVPGPRIFAEDRWRADRLQRYAGVFLRKRASLSDPTTTLHSLRHTWRTLAREIAMPASVSRAIMGHSMGNDVHEGYGAGPSLRLKAEWMSRIDPMALEQVC